MIIKGIVFIAKKIDELIQREISDEGLIKERLMALQLKFEMDEITVEEYDSQEDELLDLIENIRLNKENDQ
ncbi:hypothetical protein PI23P_02402 [Polaribacter irgensii 23-P]|uniref:Gas vesicle protein GvpG n=1 Tax=Polaribacter irgensii 23-P TaxID=313594 RepID=A4BWG7_9FLAO|nr:gas vesicle protein GvpG [Polaribacter irgensii]EAR13308.1 hypothetical protein PI23P_02402 [Polaribacter irgensii 23-P]